jgi:galactokinase
VNLIGEHTDYNDGFALPFAIDRACIATVRALDEPALLISSAQRAEPVRVALAELAPGKPAGWAGYPAGAVWAMRELGGRVPGLLIEVDSDVPSGAGLSSSAALTCAVASAVNELTAAGLTVPELVAVARRAENDFVGAPTGGMDQLASMNARQHEVLFCDMRSFEVHSIPFDLESAGLALLVVDTRAEHGHAQGEYRARRTACERASAVLGVPALRDVVDLEAALAALPSDELRRRVRHVVTENARVQQTVELLAAGEIASIGPLLDASHNSLRDDYEVSTPELDLAVSSLRAAGAFGARMTGGGFGGSAIGLLEADRVPAAVERVSLAFVAAHFAEPSAFTVTPSHGAARV